MTKPLPEWKRKDRALAERSRARFLPQVGKIKKAPNHELIRLPGNRPGVVTLYTRRKRPPNRDGSVSPVTMPYRKARSV
jgi:hypothetical protein